MVFLVKILSVLVVVFGCLVMLKPSIIKSIVSYVKVDNRIYIAAIVRSIIGAVLMLAAQYCSVPWIVLFLGALLVFTAIVCFVVKKEIIEGMLNWAENASSKKIYIIGGVALAVGILLSLGA